MDPILIKVGGQYNRPVKEWLVYQSSDLGNLSAVDGDKAYVVQDDKTYYFLEDQWYAAGGETVTTAEEEGVATK